MANLNRKYADNAKYMGYRINSLRLQDHDYVGGGIYFVTICVDGRNKYFGEACHGMPVPNGAAANVASANSAFVRLSRIGKICEEYWEAIPDHFPNAEIDEFIIMPDHIHGIIHMADAFDRMRSIGQICHGKSVPRDRYSHPLAKSLGMIINHFKGGVKRYCNQNGMKYFKWQANYFEKIISGDENLERVRKYIWRNSLEICHGKSLG